jgi:hypothetical protein
VLSCEDTWIAAKSLERSLAQYTYDTQSSPYNYGFFNMSLET